MCYTGHVGDIFIMLDIANSFATNLDYAIPRNKKWWIIDTNIGHRSAFGRSHRYKRAEQMTLIRHMLSPPVSKQISFVMTDCYDKLPINFVSLRKSNAQVKKRNIWFPCLDSNIVPFQNCPKHVILSTWKIPDSQVYIHWTSFTRG